MTSTPGDGLVGLDLVGVGLHVLLLDVLPQGLVGENVAKLFFLRH